MKIENEKNKKCHITLKSGIMAAEYTTVYAYIFYETHTQTYSIYTVESQHDMLFIFVLFVPVLTNKMNHFWTVEFL